MKKRKKIGLPPGTPVYSGDNYQEPFRIQGFHYTPEGWESAVFEEPFTGENLKASGWFWKNITGIGQVDSLMDFGTAYGLHHLFLEDCVSMGQRPKYDDYGDHAAVILPMLRWEEGRITKEQISVVLKGNHVFTFQEREGDVFDPIRERLTRKRGRIRDRGSDYLFYALIDVVVDEFFLIIDEIGIRVDELDTAISEGKREILPEVQELRKQMLLLRSAVQPVRELLNRILRDQSPLFGAETLSYFRDVFDHSIQIIDRLESYRDMLSGLRDLYMNNVSLEMNRVMQVLTVIATIFIPLTFIAGVYGMNFENMPELGWKYGYPLVWGVMILSGGALLFYFRKKKWF